MDDHGLRDHAARLLTGTGLDPDTATSAAAGEGDAVPESGLTCAAALRDGWAAASSTERAS